MYRKLVEHWKSRLSASEYRTLKSFSREMDRNSLWLGYVETGEKTVAYYTDDADWFKFSIQAMNELLSSRESGRSFDWDDIRANHQMDCSPDFDPMGPDELEME